MFLFYLKKQDFFLIFFWELFCNWFWARIILISQNICLKLLKMVTSKTEYSRLEQRSVLKFLQAGKCKSWEIYRRMCGICTKKHVWAKIFYKQTKHEFAITCHRKDSQWSGSTESPAKKKGLAAVVSKEDHADCFGEHERTHPYWVPWKSLTINNVSYCQLPWQNSPYLLNNRCIYISSNWKY